MTSKRNRLIAFMIITIMLVGFCFSTLVGCVSDKNNNGGQNGDGSGQVKPPSGDGYPIEIFDAGVYNPSKVGYTAEYLGTVERRKPEVSNGGLARYPEYGKTLSNVTEKEKQAIIDENNQINASSDRTTDKGEFIPGTYDSMDENGNLYLNNKPTGKKLYKHTASIDMYEGNLSDDEQAVIKRITMQSRPAGNHITGLYAPAGEVIKIEMSEEDLARTGGLTIYIGQILQNGQPNNIWLAREFNRMPVIVNTMTALKEVSYVGSYLGGPIYVKPVNAGAKFTVTISGGVPYSHYIQGYTTEKEFDQYKDSTAPYFDLEVWDDSVRHSGPKTRAEEFDFEELTQAAILWDKISRVSNQSPSGSNNSIGITFLYDPFIAAGGMVAFVGRNTVNCPLYCMTAALDAESAVNNASDAFWGDIHEYNHHYQKFGFAPGDEVTNNAVSLVAYSLYTRISANRELGVEGEGNYTTTWNRYTNPSWTLKQTLATTGKNSNLDSYANLLHTFGQTRFLQATRNGAGRGGADVWYKAVSDATGYDMTYYFTEVLHQDVSINVIEEYKKKKYPAFAPVSTIYQTGRSYLVDGKNYYSHTVQPYGIETGKDFVLDFKNNIVIPQDFNWKIDNITAPQYGKLVKNSDGVYTYTPDKINRSSGKMYVTLKIEKKDNAFKVDDVILEIELWQKQYNPNMLERTIYTYTDDTMYKSPVDAFESNYSGYQGVKYEDNANKVQNANTDIWNPNPQQNAIVEISGKILIPSTGKYRIAIRGRKYAAMYISLDGKNYELAANMTNETNNTNFLTDNPNNYKDYQFSKGQWVYFKEVLLVTYKDSFVGLGMSKFNTDGTIGNINYLNAYRSSYQKEEFESDYYYEKHYDYEYNEVSGKQSLVETNYQPWDSNYPIEALFDENHNNFIHSNKSNVSADNPFELTADLGRVMNANQFTIYGEPTRQYQPKDFKLYGGTELDNMQLIAEINDSNRVNHNIAVNFETCKIRYYKLVVTDTWATNQNYRFIAYRSASFAYSTGNGNWLSPDEEIFEYRGNWNLSNKFSTFGHLYEGKNAKLEFEFTGTRFAIFAFESQKYDSFEVLIDGKLIETVSIKGDKNDTKLAYLSEELTSGKHKITIRSKTQFNIDSIVLWD